MNSNAYRAQYIAACRENIHTLRAEYSELIARQKREPNPHRKAQIKREINAVKSEINANYDDIKITQENMRGLNETAKQQHTTITE